MATQTVKRNAMAALVVIGIALWIAAAFLMVQSVQNSARFSALHGWILLINAAGSLTLLVLIVVRLLRLMRAWRARVIGSRLEARMVWMFGVLAITPILLLFYFSIEFINRGIDSWFNVEVRQGLNDALTLSRAALDLRMRENLDSTQSVARELEADEQASLTSLGELRRRSGAIELTLFGVNSRILATSAEKPEGDLPLRPTEEIVWQVRQGHSYVNLDPTTGGGYSIRVAVAVQPQRTGMPPRLLQAIFPVETRISALADNVESSYQQYAAKARLREPLKTSFKLTLTLVLLMATFTALYGAFWVARRLVQPIQVLVRGTRAVAEGDFDTRLPLTSHDELGMLVHSFNDMTKRLARAREDTRHSQQAVEAERANLEVILARLSTGVISLEPDLRIRTMNQAAASILRGDLDRSDDLDRMIGQPLTAVASGAPIFEQFAEASRAHLDRGEAEWREQMELRSGTSRRSLMCACTVLPGEAERPSGYVLVFDDITALLQAQRDAAWGEVARRLAHEIKNPLTPIRLSAERLRHKLLSGMNPADALILERGTHTIVQQVEAMKDMVNAFSEYARTPKMDIAAFDLNQLVTEVTDLYRAQDAQRPGRRRLQVTLDPELGVAGLSELEADRGRIRQLLHNLIANACEALEGHVDAQVSVATHLTSRSTGAFAEIVVEDNGPGFSTDVLGRMFDPYVTTKPKGTGLGLAIVKKIVEEHGGRIEAQNNPSATGSGARIHVELPLLAANRGAANRTETARVGAGVEVRRERA
ncbi:MAG: HAMP domain-containing protein [Candidatus Obscuribacterales bacterium]|nr:HAMP domain-containing protein [Steroidobacteraceae bacterium]